MPSSVASRKRSFTTDSAFSSCFTSASAIARLDMVPHSFASMRLPAGRRSTVTAPCFPGCRKYGDLCTGPPRFFAGRRFFSVMTQSSVCAGL